MTKTERAKTEQTKKMGQKIGHGCTKTIAKRGDSDLKSRLGGRQPNFFFANLRKTSLGGWAGKFSEATLSVHNRTNSIRQIENFVFAALVDVHGVENDTEQLTYAGSTFTTGNM